jgi:hypothetical protein
MTTPSSSRRLLGTVLAGALGLWSTATSVAAQDAPTRLVLRIHEVKSVDETGHFDMGADEIDLAGIAILPDGRKVKLRTLDLGQFNKGKVKRPSDDFASFDLRNGPEFPRLFQAMLILAERDHGAGLGDYLKQVLAGSKPTVASPTDAVNAAGVATSVAAATAGDPTLIATEALRTATKLASIWAKDDIFTPRIVRMKMNRATALPGGRTATARDTLSLKQFDGHYQIVYSWRLVP